MKIKFLSIFFIFLVSFTLYNFKTADKSDYKKQYITITKLHGNSDVDINTIKAVEQEFFNKVTAKNKYIASHDILVNYSSKNISDVIIINKYNSWEDIEKAELENKAIIKKAWPDENIRAEFFSKQNGNFDYHYSDEIFVSTPYSKVMKKEERDKLKNPVFYYFIKSKLADYDYDDSLDAYTKYINNVTFKNPYIKEYLTFKHYYGTDSRDFIESYVFNSYDDLMKSMDKDHELLTKLIPDKEERDKFIETYYRGIDKISELAIYTNIPSMSK